MKKSNIVGLIVLFLLSVGIVSAENQTFTVPITLEMVNGSPSMMTVHTEAGDYTYPYVMSWNYTFAFQIARNVNSIYNFTILNASGINITTNMICPPVLPTPCICNAANISESKIADIVVSNMKINESCPIQNCVLDTSSIDNKLTYLNGEMNELKNGNQTAADESSKAVKIWLVIFIILFFTLLMSVGGYLLYKKLTKPKLTEENKG